MHSILSSLVLLAMSCLLGFSDDRGWVDLSSQGLKAWKEPGEWEVAGNAVLHPDNPKLLEAKPGTGVLVNSPKGRTRDLVSKEAFGDIEVHLEFTVPRGSNSGVKFQGLYEIQIADSWGVKNPTASHLGGIYPRAEMEPSYHHIDKGIPPRTNAARPAGEWQTLDATFLAPRFDASEKKVSNARLLKVVLNGQVIHENVELQTPTGHAWRDKEVARGPLLLQGDHGPVAFRNIRIRPYVGDSRKD